MGRSVDQLLQEVSANYSLVLSVPQRAEAVTRLGAAGFAKGIPDKHTGLAVDLVLEAAEEKSDAPRTASVLGADHTPANSLLNQANGGMCPRCHSPTKMASLRNRLPIEFCEGCHISMPTQGVQA